MAESYGKNFILNGEIQRAELFDNALVYEGESVYEVIRLVGGTPLFFSEHMERLITSVNNQKKDMIVDPSVIGRDIVRLIDSDKKEEINLKIVFNYNRRALNYLIYYIESVYPTQEQYSNGVKGILHKAERKDPESKVINNKLRSEIFNRLKNESGYEAILVNTNNLVTEGSRSNIFFLKDNTLFTAPDNLILNGITRKHILEICKTNKIPVLFECVDANDISGFEASFMTGTSPMVLPFCCIDDIHFNVKLPLMEKLRRLYILKVEESIRLFRP